MSRTATLVIVAMAALLLVGNYLQGGTSSELEGMKVAILVDDGYDHKEAIVPRDRLLRQGATVTIIGQTVKTASSHYGRERLEIEKAVTEVSVADFDALIIPGGDTSQLAASGDALAFVNEFFHANKLTCAICHGPLVLAAADVVRGREITAAFDLKDILVYSEAIYSPTTLVRDGNLITAISQEQVLPFVEEIIKALREIKSACY